MGRGFLLSHLRRCREPDVYPVAASLLQPYLEKGMVTKHICNIAIPCPLLLPQLPRAWLHLSKKRNLGDGWALLDPCNVLMKVLHSADHLAIQSCLVQAP